MNSIFGADGIYTKFKSFRNSKLNQFEGTFFFLNTLLFIMSWILLILSFKVVGSKIGAKEPDEVHDSIIAFSTIMTMFLISLSINGLIISMDRESKGC